MHPKPCKYDYFKPAKTHAFLALSAFLTGDEINISLRRVRRSKLNRPKQAKGMTRDYLERCLDAQPDDPWGLRNRAMISLGYDLLTRRSELVALRTDDIEMREDGTLRAIIRRSKADPFGMGRIGFTSKRSGEPVGKWLAWRGDSIGPLFCGIYQGKPINRPPEDVAAFSGHSLRIGAAQDLVCAGFDTAAIMRAGGWKSVNVLGRYLELAGHNVWV